TRSASTARTLTPWIGTSSPASVHAVIGRSTPNRTAGDRSRRPRRHPTVKIPSTAPATVVAPTTRRERTRSRAHHQAPGPEERRRLHRRAERRDGRSEEHTSELQSRENLVCR